MDRPTDFGCRATVGKRRRDGKYPVRFVFLSTGYRLNKLLSKDEIDADRARYANDPAWTWTGAIP